MNCWRADMSTVRQCKTLVQGSPEEIRALYVAAQRLVGFEVLRELLPDKV